MVVCVILAAGEGKRMRPLTGSRPKVMLPIAGKPMLEYLIDAVSGSGITDFILVVGYGQGAVRDYFGDGSSRGIRIRYVSQKRQAGTGDAVMTVKSFITEPFLLMNGDMILKKDDISSFLTQETPAMGIFPSDHPQDFGVVTVEGSCITGLEEKSDHPRSNLINAGIYLFTPDIFSHISRITPSSRGELELTDALSVYIRDGCLHAVSLSAWSDMGAPWDLLEVHEQVMRECSSDNQGTIEEGVVIHGDAVIGNGTLVKAGSYIEGPCIIGSDCIIGPHAYLRPGTYIGNQCHIGHASEIKNSIIMDRTNIPHFNYIGDSIIGSGCNFGAGTKVANLRHDKREITAGGLSTRRRKFGAVIGDDVLFGINCSVNVGAMIGNHCRFAPGTVIEGTIADGTVIRR